MVTRRRWALRSRVRRIQHHSTHLLKPLICKDILVLTLSSVLGGFEIALHGLGPILAVDNDIMLRHLNSRMRGRRSLQGGYSFVELIITVGMILVVTTWAMPSFLNYLRSARVRAGAQVVSAYLNEGRQLAIKTNGPVCVAHTTSTMQFKTTNCSGAAIAVAGLANASNNIRLPDNISLSLSSGSSPIFQQLGNAAAGMRYDVTDVPSGRVLRVIVSASGRVCLAPATATACP